MLFPFTISIYWLIISYSVGTTLYKLYRLLANRRGRAKFNDMKKIFIWLGSGRSKKHRVGKNGRLLDEAAKAGLPVPNGGILLDTFFQQLLQAKIMVRENGRFHIPKPVELTESLYGAARFPRLANPLTVRAAFVGHEDEAGGVGVLDVDGSDPQQLANALCAVWSAAPGRDGGVHRAIVLQERVKAQTCGVALSERAYQDDVVYATDDKMVTVPQLQFGEAPTAALPSYTRRLQRLLRGVRNTFGRGDWAVAWADDGTVCWLIQLLPATQPARREDSFIVAPSDMLPDMPTPFMNGVIANISRALIAKYQRFDPSLATERTLFREEKGVLFLNATLLTDVHRKWGMPTKRMATELGLVGKIGTGIRPLRILRHLSTLLRLGRARFTNRPPQLVPIDSFTDATNAFTTLFIHAASDPLKLSKLLTAPPDKEIARRYEAVREQFLLLSEEAVKNKQLSTVEAIWRLTPEKVCVLDKGTAFSDAETVPVTN